MTPHTCAVFKPFKVGISLVGGDQCDQLVKLCFNIWPLATMKIRPVMLQIYQSGFTILPNKK